MESLLKTLWRRLRFYLIDWGLIARRGIFYIGGSDTPAAARAGEGS